MSDSNHRHDQYVSTDTINTFKVARTPEAYGAVGDGVTDDQVAIQNALNALKVGEHLVFASGKTYAHSGVLLVANAGVTVRGGGTLLATTPNAAAFRITGNNVTVDGLTIKLKPAVSTTVSGALNTVNTTVVVASATGISNGMTLLIDPATATAERVLVTNVAGTTLTVTRAQNGYPAKSHANGATIVAATRQSSSNSHLLFGYNCTGLVVRNCTFYNGDAAASLLAGVTYFVYENNIVYGGLADSFHSTAGTSYGLYKNCTAYYGGDDSFPVVGYDTDPQPGYIVFDGCRSIMSFARAFAVVGGANVTYRGCYAEDSSAASFYVACESSFSSLGVSNVLFENCSSLRANTYAATDHGSIFILNGRGGSFVIDNVIFRNIALRKTTSTASREMGFIGYSTPIITNIRYEKIDVIDGGTTFGFNSNISATLAANSYQDITKITTGAGATPVSGNWTLVGQNSATTATGLTVTCTDIGSTQYQIVIQAQNTSVAEIPIIQFNGDTAANYTYRYMTAAENTNTLTNVQSTSGQTSAQLSGSSRTGERNIIIDIQGDSLNRTGIVTQAASPRSKTTATGTWDMAGEINWYSAGFGSITSVFVGTVGGIATYNKIRVWVYAIAP